MAEDFEYESQTERAFAALIDLLNVATKELNRPKSKFSWVNSGPPVALAMSAIFSLLEDHDSARRYVAMHLTLLEETSPEADVDASLDSIYRLYGDSHGLPQGDSVREGARRWREALANGTATRGDPLMFGLRLLIQKVYPRLSGNRDLDRLMVGICLALKFCMRLLEPHERSYQETVEFAVEYLDEVASKKKLNSEELRNYILWHMNQHEYDFIETLATIMEEVPCLFASHYPPLSWVLLEPPESECLRARLQRATGVSA